MLGSAQCRKQRTLSNALRVNAWRTTWSCTRSSWSTCEGTMTRAHCLLQATCAMGNSLRCQLRREQLGPHGWRRIRVHQPTPMEPLEPGLNRLAGERRSHRQAGGGFAWSCLSDTHNDLRLAVDALSGGLLDTIYAECGQSVR